MLGLSDFGLCDAEIEQLFWKSDVNHDGKISEQEFIDAHCLDEIWARHRIELRGVSVEHLCAPFLEAVHTSGFTRDAKVYEIEPKVIRGRSSDTICPRDGRLGSAYVDAIGSGDRGH